MAAIVITENAKATWLTGLAGQARDVGQRAMAYAAAMVMICAVGAALLQLAAQILTFPAPIAAAATTLMAAALLTSLRRHLRTQGRAPARPRKPA